MCALPLKDVIVLCGGPCFCFILFCFFIHKFSKIYEITLFCYKTQNEAKKKRKEEKGGKRENGKG